MTTGGHEFRFFRAGGVDQVELARGDDFAALRALPQPLWVALSLPVTGTALDASTLRRVDTDRDDRIRPPELLAAVEWASRAFASLDVLLEPGDLLRLDSLHPTTAEGRGLRATAERVLSERGEAGRGELSLADVTEHARAFASTPFNGDGVVPPESASDPALRRAAEEVMACVGSTLDRGGKPGLDAARVSAFFEEAEALLAWERSGATAERRPLGDATERAALAWEATAAKLQDFFIRLDVSAFDPRAAVAVDELERGASPGSLGGELLSEESPLLARLPLARPTPSGALALGSGINPAWAARLEELRTSVIEPLLGPQTELTASDWRTLRERLGPHLAWRAARPRLTAGALSLVRLRELHDAGVRDALLDLVKRDAAQAATHDELERLDQAVRYRRDLATLARNFVSFDDFYRKGRAAFQAGTLLLDARTCELVLHVADPAKHATLAGLSGAFLAYCALTRGSQTRHVVAAFTNGATDHLLVGRNGIFYDRDGLDWDATITSVVPNPVSLREAFWSPYKRLVRLVEEQVARRATDKEQAASQAMEGAAGELVQSDRQATPPRKMELGMLAAVGVAAAGVATFASSVVATFLSLGVWMPIGVLAVVGMISGPSVVIAWLKLRRRSLGPLLDASGWAINGHTRLTVPLGAKLTTLAELPPGASRSLVDPYAPRAWLGPTLLALALGAFVGWASTALDGCLPEGTRLRDLAPAASSSTSASGAPASAPPLASAAPASATPR